MTTIHLTDQQLTQLADRIAARLASPHAVAHHHDDPMSYVALLDASQLAGALGCSRAFVYQHASELGGQRLGNGSKPRLRFSLEEAKAAMPRLAGERSQGSEASIDRPSAPTRSTRTSRLPNGLPRATELLGLDAA